MLSGHTNISVGAGLTLSSTNVLSAIPAIVTDPNRARTLSNADNGKTLVFTNNLSIALTVPPGLTSPFQCIIVQFGTGQVTPTAGLGVSVKAFGGHTKTAGQDAVCALISVATNSYRLSGTTV